MIGMLMSSFDFSLFSSSSKPTFNSFERKLVQLTVTARDFHTNSRDKFQCVVAIILFSATRAALLNQIYYSGGCIEFPHDFSLDPVEKICVECVSARTFFPRDYVNMAVLWYLPEDRFPSARFVFRKSLCPSSLLPWKSLGNFGKQRAYRKKKSAATFTQSEATLINIFPFARNRKKKTLKNRLIYLSPSMGFFFFHPPRPPVTTLRFPRSFEQPATKAHKCVYIFSTRLFFSSHPRTETRYSTAKSKTTPTP